MTIVAEVLVVEVMVAGGRWWVLTANDAHESSAGEFDRVPVERVLEPLLVVIKAQCRSVVHSTNVNHRVAGHQGVGVARADDSGAAPGWQHAQHRASKRLVAVELAIVRANLRCWGYCGMSMQASVGVRSSCEKRCDQRAHLIFVCLMAMMSDCDTCTS
jgi:hypothetical protein